MTTRAHWLNLPHDTAQRRDRRVTDKFARGDSRMVLYARIRDSDTPIMLRVRPITLGFSVNGFVASIDMSRDDAKRLGEQLLRLYRECGEPAPPSPLPGE